MRFGATVLALAAALLVAAFLVGGTGNTASALQETVTVALGPTEGPAGGGDQTGTATLTAAGDQTEVVVSIDPSPEGAEVEQPAHIHAGTCGDNLGAVEYPLTNVVDGSSTTTVDASLASLQTGDFAINVHKSGEEIGVYVSCGNIPAAAAEEPEAANGLPSTGGPPSGNSTQAWSYLLIAAGVLALLGGGTVAALRLRRQR